MTIRSQAKALKNARRLFEHMTGQRQPVLPVAIVARSLIVGYRKNNAKGRTTILGLRDLLRDHCRDDLADQLRLELLNPANVAPPVDGRKRNADKKRLCTSV